MVKKRVIFVIESLKIGGAEKSLGTLLSLIDKKQYEIDLYLFRRCGDFLSLFPSGIHLLEEDKKSIPFGNFKTAWFKYLIQFDFKRSWNSFCWLVGCFVSKCILKKPEYIGWNFVKKIISPINEKYDIRK